ncbi:MAG: hypothetical protein A3B38_02720 [Candidatus Levybacteria bacterium RIFCSPLOWO2_01_FULL_36_13]|nr:MAG: hypothetical protein A2684_03915 [Candidatus Levybacteria bacterium RIFCSPHIGHO2_01_FULL_36_15b]OGH35191.1 MAG: hypothetical protein A3B38_02720 [Candidatus Levybacteria bacterium RIFCSPLOWO2_01_FULL_36_13]
MVEQEVNYADEKQISHIYSEAVDLLEKHGERYYNYDGIEISAKSFFCNENDSRGSSDICLDADATEGIAGSIILRLIRQKGTNAYIRELTFDSSKVINLTVREKVNDGTQSKVKTTYSGGLDKAWITLETVSKYLEEARVNLEANYQEPPCEDEKPSRFTAIPHRLLNVFNVKR